MTQTKWPPEKLARFSRGSGRICPFLDGLVIDVFGTRKRPRKNREAAVR